MIRGHIGFCVFLITLSTGGHLGCSITPQMARLIANAKSTQEHLLIISAFEDQCDASAVPVLIDIVNDTKFSIDIKIAAMRALGTLSAEQAVPDIVAKIDEEAIQQEALFALARIGTYHATGAIAKGVLDRNPKKRLHTILAMRVREKGTAESDDVKIIINYLKFDNDTVVAEAAKSFQYDIVTARCPSRAQSFRAYHPTMVEVASVLIDSWARTVVAPGAAVAERRASLRYLCRFEPLRCDSLVEQIQDDSDPDIRRFSMNRLCSSMSESCKQAMTQALADGKSEFASMAMDRLSDLPVSLGLLSILFQRLARPPADNDNRIFDYITKNSKIWLNEHFLKKEYSGIMAYLLILKARLANSFKISGGHFRRESTEVRQGLVITRQEIGNDCRMTFNEDLYGIALQITLLVPAVDQPSRQLNEVDMAGPLFERIHKETSGRRCFCVSCVPPQQY